VAEGSTSMLYL